MIKNYFKVAWRNLVKNKTHSSINIIGLSVGMAVAMLIGLWIFDELSYNKYYPNYDRIVRVMQYQTLNGNVLTQTNMPIPLGYKLKEDYKNDFKYITLANYPESHILTFGDKKLNQVGTYMQEDGPKILSLQMQQGTANGLDDPSSFLLSAKLAKALFGSTDPINKVIKIDNAFNVKVTGVYQDMPQNTEFNDVAFIGSWNLFLTTQPWLKRARTRWGNNSFQIFAELYPNGDINRISRKIRDVKLINITKQDKFGASFKPELFLYPMRKWHLYSEFKNGVNTGGRIQYVWMFGIIGVFVLLLACINFMNLSTARSEKRAKEVGIRKTVGSLRSQLIGQFYSESLLVALIAFIISLPIVQLILPWFNQVADKEIHILWFNPFFWLSGIGFSVFTGIIAGSYPALYLSSFEPVKVLKGTFKAGRFAAVPRKVLVVLQFTVSVTLIIGTIIVFRQIQFTKNRPIGYDRTGMLQVIEKTNDTHKNFHLIRQDLLNAGIITEAAESGSPLTDVWSNSSGYSWKDKPSDLQDDFGIIPVTPGFGKTAGWQIINGRDFSKDFLTDSSAIILNEAAVKFMNLKHPVGEIITEGNITKYTVIGVIKDLVMSSPYEPVKPTLFFYLGNNQGSIVSLRINPKISMHNALAKIEAVFKQYDPASPFTYKFTDEEYERKFDNEERIGKLAGFFTILAIVISCIGLFGMASFMAEQRIKEIGIRKVLGASVLNLWQLMSREFVLLVVISLFIAIPIAYYFMHNWLQKYTYHSDLSWGVFVLTGLGAITITLLTVSYQSLKAALINPVKSLKTE